MAKKLYAEDINYWKSSRSSPLNWIEKSINMLKKAGATNFSHAIATQNELSAVMIQFDHSGDTFVVKWPVLPSRTNNSIAAQRQATTMVYHHIKALIISSTVLGIRAAFASHWLLPNGQTVAESTSYHLMDNIPALLKSGAS